jgi:hypothetical protein
MEPPDYSSKPLICDATYQQALADAFGEYWAALCQLPHEDYLKACGRISDLQGDSPRDKAWPTEGANTPQQAPVWDASGRYRLDVVAQVYREYVAAGQIRGEPSTVLPDSPSPQPGI